MPYCTPNNVRLLTATTFNDSEIELLIEESDAEIDRRIGVQDPTSKLVRKLSALITAKTIRSSYPNSVSIGEYQQDEQKALTDWSSEIERIYRALSKPKVSSANYGHITESQRYPEGC